jgi:hypothetical protein
MTVRKEMPFKEGVYFITFTCYKWLSLIDMVDAYGEVYKQFDILKSEGHFIIGYAPITIGVANHVHSLIAFRDTGKSINRRVGTAKRFLAYELVERLKKSGKHELLEKLKAGVNNTDKSRGKLHEVFEPYSSAECS